MATRKSEWYDWIKALLIAVALTFIIRMFFFSPIIVDGPSMLPTLRDRDQIVVNKFIYRIQEPKRFDIVIFHASPHKDFIKRVIGLPGERISMQDNVLYVDGEEIDEYFLNESNGGAITWTNNFEVEDIPGGFEVIPEGHALVLGDNRSNSTDSRKLGLISMEEVIGKASVVYWPLDRMQTVK